MKLVWLSPVSTHAKTGDAFEIGVLSQMVGAQAVRDNACVTAGDHQPCFVTRKNRGDTPEGRQKKSIGLLKWMENT